jgi:hypothetical protein
MFFHLCLLFAGDELRIFFVDEGISEFDDLLNSSFIVVDLSCRIRDRIERGAVSLAVWGWFAKICL